MKRNIRKLLIVIMLVAMSVAASQANAAIVSVSGPSSNLGTAPAIIPTPPHALDGVVTNTGMQGFDEAQGVLTTVAHAVDGGSIAAGTLVDSHMIFLNSADGTQITHYDVVWTFSRPIVGVMSDRDGHLEANSTWELGNPATNYTTTFVDSGPAAPFRNRGFDSGGPDLYTLLSPNTLEVDMRVTEPGDWIRVITADPTIQVDIDIKPGSCPNPLNVTKKGVLPVAVLGSEEFDVTTVDPASIRLEGVAPIRSSYEDVATPVLDSEDECACTTEGPDGYLDLTLKFDAEETVAALGQIYDGDLVPLTLTGLAIDGVPIVGTDCVLIIDNTKPLITGVVRDGVTEGQPNIATGPDPRGLQEGSHAFMDRPVDEDDTRNYHWESIPAELVGADYVMTYNADCKPKYAPKVYNVSYSVTLGKAAKLYTLYVFVDQRCAPFTWLTDGNSGAVFEDTGLNITLNEVGGREVLQPFDVYGAEVSAGTYILGPSCDGRNFYSIAATKR